MDYADRVTNENSLDEFSLLFDTLLRVSQTLRLRLNSWLARFELNDGRYAVLKTLASAPEGGCSQAELADHLGQSESNISTLIERMERDGLVTRLRSKADRRKRVLSISAAGRVTLSDVERNQAKWAAHELSGISGSQRSTLIALLRQLGRSFENASRADSDGLGTIRIAAGTQSPSITDHRTDPIDDPKSPQFALQQMLLALSVHAGTDSMEKDVA